MSSKNFTSTSKCESHFIFKLELPTVDYILFTAIKRPLRTVERWSVWFREGREEIEDEPRPDRLVIETTSENIEQVRLTSESDSRTTHRILSSHLNLRKSTDRYVSKHQTYSQRFEQSKRCRIVA